MALSKEEHKAVLQHIFGEEGCHLGIKLAAAELEEIRNLIRQSWEDHLVSLYPQHKELIRQTELDDYHRIAAHFDHSRIWPKRVRLFKPRAVAQVKALDFFQTLREAFGDFLVSNEEGIYPEEIYWRLVRPLPEGSADVGPLHADAWFWDLGHGKTPEQHTRVKLWASVFNEPGASGFKFVPGSHHHKYAFAGEKRDGYVKPRIAVPESELETTPFRGGPGEVILFNDQLLHGGFQSPASTKTRASFEFTLMVPNEEITRRGIL